MEYAAKVYDSGSLRGGDYDIEQVYFIGILGRDRIFERCGPEWKDRYISEYTFREKHTGEVPDESILLRFVELDRSEYIMTVPIRAMGPLLYVE